MRLSFLCRDLRTASIVKICRVLLWKNILIFVLWNFLQWRKLRPKMQVPIFKIFVGWRPKKVPKVPFFFRLRRNTGLQLVAFCGDVDKYDCFRSYRLLEIAACQTWDNQLLPSFKNVTCAKKNNSFFFTRSGTKYFCQFDQIRRIKPFLALGS